jgi:hypothetical protein
MCIEVLVCFDCGFNYILRTVKCKSKCGKTTATAFENRSGPCEDCAAFHGDDWKPGMAHDPDVVFQYHEHTMRTISEKTLLAKPATQNKTEQPAASKRVKRKEKDETTTTQDIQSTTPTSKQKHRTIR